MVNFFRKILKKFTASKEDVQHAKDLCALGQFILHPEGARTVSPQEAQRNVYASLVELTQYNQHASNGILVTQNGYFITAYHCVEGEKMSQRSMRTQSGSQYTLERVCAIETSLDVALVKAALPGPALPCDYAFQAEEFTVQDPVMHLARWNGQCLRKKGKIVAPWVEFQLSNKDKTHRRHFYTDIPVIPGDSGGIVTCPRGSVAGICSTGEIDRTGGSAVRWQDALVVIRQYLETKHDRAGYGSIPWHAEAPRPQQEP